jgi:EmrB/QacA subfamily drug resistance transporter
MKDAVVEGISRKPALFVAVLASFLTPFVGSSVNVALKSIGTEFALNALTLDWIVTAYLLAAAIFLVPFGRLADIKGRKLIFTIGIIIDFVGSLLAIFSVSGSMLIACRVLQGIGGAMIFGTSIAIVTTIYPPAERGKILGLTTAAVYVGLSIGPPVSGFLTQYFSWRSIFAIDAIIGLIIIVAAFWKLKGEWIGARGEKFDAAGSVVYGISLLALMYGFSELPSTLGLVAMAAGILGIVSFIIFESKITSPVLNIRLFKESLVFSLSNVAALINYSATFAVGFLMSLYLQYIKGFDPQTAGLVLLVQPVLMAILSPFSGRLSDRLEPRVLASIGMAISTAGLCILIFLGQNTSIALVIAGLAVLGIGFGFFSSPNTNAVMSSIERKYYGVASGTLGTMRLVGQMLSLGIVTVMFALFLGHAAITIENFPLFLASFRTAFIVFAVLCFGGVFASYARGKTDRNKGI